VRFVSADHTREFVTIHLNAASDCQGPTLITCTVGTNSDIFVKLGTANALPATTVLILDGGNGAGSGRPCEINLNGNDLTLAGLTDVTGRTLRTQRVNNTSATPATLTVNHSADHTYAAQLGGSGTNLSLTKSGIGVFTLTGSVSYAGDTTVTGGTLNLGNTNGGNDLSTVTIAAAAASLQLSFAGTDIVDKLFIGTTQQAAGVYGHTSSGATNGGLGVGAMNAYFEPGTLTLTVTVTVTVTLSGNTRTFARVKLVP